MEWPPRSGRMREFPEIDRVEWFGLEDAREKIKAAQAPFVDRLSGRWPTIAIGRDNRQAGPASSISITP